MRSLSVFMFLAASTLTQAAGVVPEKELLIRDLSVVNDGRATAAGGAWSLGYLLSQMVPEGADPGDFVSEWIDQWVKVKTVNGFAVAPRPQVKQELLKQWPKRPDGKIDIFRAPFRLLAIVNRTDNEGPFTPGAAGELRFEYCTYNRAGDAENITAPTPVNFLLIVEFLQPRGDRMTDRRSWANRWHRLASLPFGESFNSELQSITDSVTRSRAMPLRPNGSALNHLRTEEILVDGKPRNYRSFALNSRGELALTPLEQTPDATYLSDPMEVSTLVDWITGNANEILDDQHIVPASFLAGEAAALDGSTAPTHYWGAPLLQSSPTLQAARKKFALSSCTGCHNSYENNGSFLQMLDRDFNAMSQVSDFLEQDLVRRALVMEGDLSGKPPVPSASAH